MAKDEMKITDEKALSIKYDGEEITFKHFAPKETNLIKIRIHDDGKDGEGIWACVSDEDRKKYDDETNTTDLIMVNLRNTSLYGIPWGCYVPAKCNGSDRPQCDINMIDGSMLFNQVETV